MNRTFARRIAAALAGPAVAAGILAGTLAVSAPAEASPSSSTKCSSMAMPGTVAGASANQLNPLTRAAQVAATDPTPLAPTFNIPC